MLNGRVVAQIGCDIQYIGDAEPPFNLGNMVLYCEVFF